MQQLLIIEVISVIIEVISLSFFSKENPLQGYVPTYACTTTFYPILLCFDHAGLDLYAAVIHN